MSRAVLVTCSLLALAARAGRPPVELDVGASLSSNFSPDVVFAQRLGPQLSVGLVGLPLGPLTGGARLGLKYDLSLHRQFELQGQLLVQRRFGAFQPSLAVGTNVFLEGGRGAHVFTTLGVALLLASRFEVFLEVSPGVLIDRFGPAFWLMVGLGVRVHFEVVRAPRG